MLDQFYTITKIEMQEEGIWMEVELNSGHAVYSGHFPGMPVVPGVCSLMIVKECVEKWKGQRYIYRYLQTCKFLAAIRPEQDRVLGIKVDLQEKPEGIFLLQAQMYSGDKIVLKLKANLTLG